MMAVDERCISACQEKDRLGIKHGWCWTCVENLRREHASEIAELVRQIDAAKAPSNSHHMTDHQIIEAMITYGGSFAQSLAKSWQCADADNQARLKAAFPEYWAKYQELAELQEQRAANRS